VGAFDSALQDAGATVQFFRNEVHRAAVVFITGVEYSLVCVQSGVHRQQGGVNVQDPAIEAVDEPRTQDAHEAREHQQFRLPFVELGGDRPVELLTRFVVAMFDACRIDSGVAGACQPERIRPV
jgi:hypothetical protein